MATMAIRTIEISPHDGWILGYVTAYLLPLASTIIKEIDFTILGIIAAIVVLVFGYSNTSSPNPLLAIRRYHFYQVLTENGIADYVLISKRKLRNKKDLKVVNRMFEFLLVDVEER